jgi:hypothetical protein
MIKAQWEEKELSSIKLQKGSIMTSLNQIAEGVERIERGRIKTPARKSIIKILDWLESNSMIRRESNKLGTIIYINNYDTYNDNETRTETPEFSSSSPTTSPTGSPTKSHQSHTNNNIKHYKHYKELKDKKNSYDSTFVDSLVQFVSSIP